MNKGKNSIAKACLSSILVIVIGFLAAGIFTAVITAAGIDNDISASLARILVSAGLLVLFAKEFDFTKSFSGLAYALPALLIVLWNLIYNPVSGMKFAGFAAVPAALLNGSAPGLFEEILFRGIFTGRLRRAGASGVTAMVIPAVLFGAIHLTNAVSLGLANVLVQTFYATVIGLLFGAVYVRSSDIASVVLMHSLIDISSRIFTGESGDTPLLWIILFVVLMAGLLAYVVRLAAGFSRNQKKETENFGV